MNERLNIVHVQTSDLRPSEYNPRKWSAEAEEQLAESVRKFGIVDPGTQTPEFERYLFALL